MSRPKIISDDDILAFAFPIISREGFESFTLEQISEVTGLAPATLIRRFKTKKDLALLARNWKWNNLLSNIGKNNSQKTGIEAIYELIEEIAKSVDNINMSEHMKMLAEDAKNTKLKILAFNYFQWTRDLLQNFIIQAIEKNELYKEINPIDLSFHLEAIIQGTIFQSAFLDVNDIKKQLIKGIKYALKPYIIE